MTDFSIDDLNLVLARRYAVEREIAAGGMATVYLVRDEKHDRKVALKVMKGAVAEGGTHRFLREIGVTARLSHPHILPLLDSGDLFGLPFYAMPYVDGETLRDRMAREGRLPVDDAIHLAAEVADALAYAHAQGIVHRDIKPANLLLTGRHVIVADFGVAKALSAPATADDATQAGLAIGTVAYMSPEQAVGEPNIDGRSDIFSLGVVLYEMLTGEKAFGGTTMQEQMARRFSGVVPSARSRRVEVPPDLDAVLARALAADPKDRYATAGEFEAAILASSRSGPPTFGTGIIHVARHPTAVPSIAVLPFRNLGGSPEGEYLSDGLAEDVLTQLTLRRTLRVCARHSSFALRDSTDDVRTIGRRLGVRHLLTGSVRRAGDRLRVTVQLVDAETGYDAWSGRYDRELADVLAIQDEISAAIAQELNATLLGAITAPGATPAAPRLDVYEAVLKARHWWNRRTGASMDRAIEGFRAAIALDPGHAASWAGLAQVLVTQAIYGAVEPRTILREAREAASEALRLDPSLAEARTALAQAEVIESRDWGSAEQMFRQAIALNPQLAAAHQGLAIMVLTPRGRHEEALAAIRQAIGIDPLSAVMGVTLASVHLYARRFAEARDAARGVLEMEPAFAPAHFFLAQSLLESGDIEGAASHAERAVELSGGSSETLAVRALVAARAGERERAQQLADELGRASARQYASPAHRALAALALDKVDESLEHLTHAVEARAADVLWLGVRPAWDPLRGVPAFDRLLTRLGLS